MELLRPHRPRDLARPKLRAEQIAEEPARAEELLRVRALARMVGHEALDALILGIEPEHPADRFRHEHVALDMAQAPDEEVEPLLVRDLRQRVVMVPVEDDQTREPDSGP